MLSRGFAKFVLVLLLAWASVDVLRILFSMVVLVIRLFNSNVNKKSIVSVFFNGNIDKGINIVCVVNVAFMVFVYD